MSSSNGGKGDSDGDKHNKNKNKGKSSSSSSITSEQNSYLEEFFECCQHPEEIQEEELAKLLGLQREQVAKWFHDKRTQAQAQVAQSEPKFPILESSQEEVVPKPLERSPTPNVIPGEAEEFLKEKSRMLEIAKSGYEELNKLFQNESLWVKSSLDGRMVLDTEKYKQMFPRDTNPNVFKTSQTREESSKASTVVSTTLANKLFEALLSDPKGLGELFPTMVQRAEIIQEYEHGTNETKHGTLLLMYLETHHLSPLMIPRKYFFLRYCEHVHGSGTWVISDVSLDSLGGNLPHSPCWKFPSGCRIRHLPPDQNGRNTTLVEWIEHVEVNDIPQTNSLYRDVVANNIPFSAGRWIMFLLKNNEKLFHCQAIYNNEAVLIEGRGLLQISHRMVRSFCQILNMSGKPEITHFTQPPSNTNSKNSNNSYYGGEIKYSLHKNSAPGHPIGMIASLVTSFWVPLNFHEVFCFLTDATKRNQWDTLCTGHCAFEVANLQTGDYIGNRISVIRQDLPMIFNFTQPCGEHEKNEMIILQESSIDPVEAYIVYAPIARSNMHLLLNRNSGPVSSEIEVLSSGFALTGDANSVAGLMKRAGMPDYQQQFGTLLTMAYQIPVSSTPSTKMLKMKNLEVAHNIFRIMVSNVKVALGCPNI